MGADLFSLQELGWPSKELLIPYRILTRSSSVNGIFFKKKNMTVANG